MKKLVPLIMPALIGLALVVGGPAQAGNKKPAGAAPSKPAGAAAKKPAVKKDKKAHEGTASVHGIVKGAPSGETFTVAAKGKTVTVDASKAKVRVNGKFAKASVITAGTMVTARGSMAGDKLMATDVDAHLRGGGKKKETAKKPVMKPMKMSTSPMPKATAAPPKK